MLLKYHFRAQQDKTVPIFRVKSDWEPPEYNFPPLQKYFGHVLKDITDLYKQPTTNKVNLSQDESKALGELKQMKDIVIKSADKGGVEWGWFAVGSLCESLILGIDDTSGGG